MTSFILSTGSLESAAAVRKTGLTCWIVAMTSRIERGHMHLMGKLMVVRLNLPLRIFLPTLLRISFPADLNLAESSASFKSKPPQYPASGALQSSLYWLNPLKFLAKVKTSSVCAIACASTSETCLLSSFTEFLASSKNLSNSASTNPSS